MTMIIPILASAGPESTEGLEWVMLELNGELLKPLDINDETSHHRNPRRSRSLSPDGTAAAAADDDDVRRRVELGSVRFDSDGAPTLIIGNHELRGSAISLKEPFAVLRKRKKATTTTTMRISHISSSVSTTGGSRSSRRRDVHLEVVGVVRRKLMFDQYPKSIMRSQG